MTYSNLLTRAKQGDVDAIANLLANALQKHQVAVKGRLEETCLQLLLEYPEPLDQGYAISLVEQGMQRLKPQGIQFVKVSGRLLGSTKLAWSSSFPLEVINSHASQELTTTSLKQELTPVASTQASTGPANAEPSPWIDSTGWGALITGLILGSLLFAVGLLKLLFRGFLIMVHEVGHAVTHWAFGRPALPTVNLLHGGGVTLHFQQVPLLVLLIYAGIGWLFYWQRSHPRCLGGLTLGTVLYTYCLLTSTNQMLAVFMGHGMELVAITLCLFLAASGYFCRFTGDRTIYAMLGFFTFFNDIEFAWKLSHDFDFRSWYEAGIGGVIDNDFVILADQYWNVDLAVIANLFLLGCFAAPAIAACSLFLLQRSKKASQL